MSNVASLLEKFEKVAARPGDALKAALAKGQKVVGCMPVYCPQEVVHAAGMLPFGIWGAERDIDLAKSYFPSFLCSIAQSSLEMGLKGDLDKLTAVMVPVLCDTLKCLGQNWKAGVPQVPFIQVTHPQNRKLEAGVTFLATQYQSIADKLEKLGGKKVTSESLFASIKVFNANRAALRDFVKVAADYPDLISPLQRNAVIKSGLFMDKAEHTAMVLELVATCTKETVKPWTGRKVVVTGILADSTDILKIFADNKLAIVADEVAQESRQFRTDVPTTDKDGFVALARQLSVMEGCSVLYDPEKMRGDMIVDMAKKSGAQGVVVLLTKFCDPEEFDYPFLKRSFDAAGLPSVIIEVDQQMRNYEQARTAIQTFAEVLK